MGNRVGKRPTIHVDGMVNGPSDLSDRDKPMNKWMDTAAHQWIRLGHILGRRPIQTILSATGLIVVLLAFSILFIQQTKNTSAVHSIRTEFCSGPQPITNDRNEERCHVLLDKLLANPTQAQKERLKELTTSGD